MPMNRTLYPEDWGAIALSIKEASNWICQDCGRVCRRSGEQYLLFLQRQHRPWKEVAAAPGRYILTVAHLDQDPSNNSPENLRALCTVCHLRYDHKHHLLVRQSNRYRRREAAGQMVLRFPSSGGGSR